MDDLEKVNETSLLKQRRFLHSLTQSLWSQKVRQQYR